MKSNSITLFLLVAIYLNLLRSSSRSMTTVHAPTAIIQAIQHAPMTRSPQVHAPVLSRESHAPAHSPPSLVYAPLRLSNRTAPALSRSIRSSAMLTHAPIRSIQAPWNRLPPLHRQSGMTQARTLYFFTRRSVDVSDQTSTSGSALGNADGRESGGNGIDQTSTSGSAPENADGRESGGNEIACSGNTVETTGADGEASTGSAPVNADGRESGGKSKEDKGKTVETTGADGEGSTGSAPGNADGRESGGKSKEDKGKTVETTGADGEASTSGGIEGVADEGEDASTDVVEFMADALRSSRDFLAAIFSWMTPDVLVEFLKMMGEFGGVAYTGLLIAKAYKLLREKYNEGLYVVKEVRENSLCYTFFNMQDVEEKRLTTKIENGSVLFVYGLNSKKKSVKHEIDLPPGDYSLATSVAYLDTELGILFVQIENFKTSQHVDIKINPKK